MSDSDQNNSNSSNLYSRRRFLRKSALGLGAAALTPWYSFADGNSSQDQKYYEKWRQIKELPDQEKLSIALLGLGSYATYQLAPALQQTKLCKLNGIVTGTPSKEDRWSQKYNIPEKNIYNYDTFDQIADNEDIDIIYVVTPNSLHPEYTIRAAEAGKHVISEKPMATSVEDCQAMIDACDKAGKKLSIGYRLHFEPHNQEVMRLGQEEVFGSVQQMEGGHSFRIGDNPDIWRLDKELSGGGPLMDIGIYVVQSAIYTMGELPKSLTARTVTNNARLFDEVEETIYWELQFPGGAAAKGESSYSQDANYHRAEAENGWFELRPAYSYSGINGDTSEGTMDFPQVNQQTLQMDAFADCILNDKDTRVPGEMGKRDVKILMALYEAAASGKRVQLNW